jgi:glycosyltransferase involved in cell wall biosynthesis
MNTNPTSDGIYVSFVMPCLNESATLEICIQQAQNAIRKLSVPCEIIVADNGSSDGSYQLAAQLGARVINVLDRGYGAALIQGCLAAVGTIIVMADSDSSYDLVESVEMIHLLKEGADLVVGSRLKGKIHKNAMPWLNRYVGNPLLTGLLNLVSPSGLSDAHCGMRAFTRSAFDRMELTSSGMEFASEMILKATQLGLVRREVPINYYKDGRNHRSHLRIWRDGWRHVNIILRYGWMRLFPDRILVSQSSNKTAKPTEVHAEQRSAILVKNNLE